MEKTPEKKEEQPENEGAPIIDPPAEQKNEEAVEEKHEEVKEEKAEE